MSDIEKIEKCCYCQRPIRIRGVYDGETGEEYEYVIPVVTEAIKQAHIDGMKEALEIVNVVIGSPKLAQKLTRAIESAMEVNND